MKNAYLDSEHGQVIGIGGSQARDEAALVGQVADN